MYLMFCGVFRENAMVFVENQSCSGVFPFGQYRINVSSGYSRSFSPEIRHFFLGNTAQMRLRILTDLFRQKFVRKTLKYTKYSCGFPPFSDEKSLVRLSCRVVRCCPKSERECCQEGTAHPEGWNALLAIFVFGGMKNAYG